MRICGDTIVTMLDTAPKDWWRFVPCATCNSPRQADCQSTFGPARNPHATRYRSGLVLHGTLWLLANGFETDVIGVSP